MSKYTADQVREAIESFSACDIGGELMAIAKDYAALLREHESAKAAVTDEMTDRAITAWFSAPVDVSELADAGMATRMRAALEAVAPILASARVPDVDLVERCKEVLAWKSTGLLRGDYLREYAKAAPNHDDDLQWAEEQTKTQAMRVLTAAPKPETEE